MNDAENYFVDGFGTSAIKHSVWKAVEHPVWKSVEKTIRDEIFKTKGMTENV